MTMIESKEEYGAVIELADKLVDKMPEGGGYHSTPLCDLIFRVIAAYEDENIPDPGEYKTPNELKKISPVICYQFIAGTYYCKKSCEYFRSRFFRKSHCALYSVKLSLKYVSARKILCKAVCINQQGEDE